MPFFYAPAHCRVVSHTGGRQAAYGGMFWWGLIEVKEYQGDCVGITFYDGRNGMGCWCLNGDCVGDACCEECQV